jgi:hypothetical protein
MKKRHVLFYSLLFLVAACTEEVKPIPYSYTRYFTGTNSRTWKLTHLTIKQQGKGDINFTESDLPFALGGSCAADDRYIFYANSLKSFEANEGASKCAEGDPQQIVSDVWTFSNANATLTFIFPLLSTVDRLPFFVRSADDSEMELEIFLDQNNTSSYRFGFKATDNN